MTRTNDIAHLDLWRDGTARQSIEDFVHRVTDVASAEFVEVPSRVAVFDNDGTLWPEKPLPVELIFILDRFAALARDEPAMGERHPWKAALTGDVDWLTELAWKHCQGDDRDLQVLVNAITETFAGMPVDEYERVAKDFIHRAEHPVLRRRLFDCSYAPMVSLMRYLEAHGFSIYVASGGDRDFMRVFIEDLCGIPAGHLIGRASALRFASDDGDSVAYLANPHAFDDGLVKPTRIWSQIGRRPILAFGNSDGDIEMLQFAGGRLRPGLRLVLRHDDPLREFSYMAGSSHVLDTADSKGWTIVSMKDDWERIFPGEQPGIDGVAPVDAQSTPSVPRNVS
jgi:phosphoserine phosphatase